MRGNGSRKSRTIVTENLPHAAQPRLLFRLGRGPVQPPCRQEPMDAEDLTAPILPSERNDKMSDKDVGRSARLDMQKAQDLALQSRDRVR